MKVERIYTRNVMGVTKSSTIQVAADLMRKHHVGTLLVVGDEPEAFTFLGFITDRDMVLQAVADGLDPKVVTVGRVMTPSITTVSEHADVHEALETMRTAGVRRLIVLDPTGSVAGILSMDDIIDGIAADVASLAELLRRERRREKLEYEELPEAA